MSGWVSDRESWRRNGKDGMTGALVMDTQDELNELNSDALVMRK